jgi:hypothetical protein
VRRELREQVLPYVPDGEPTQQLRAALHLLGRLEHSWDLMPTYLVADNADLRASLAELSSRTGVSWTDDAATASAVPGVQDPTLRGLIAANAHLQAELDRLQQHWRADADGDPEVERLLLALHTRMAERAGAAAAVDV